MARGSRTAGMRQEFDREAGEYDRAAPASMPAYSDLHSALVWGIPYVPTRTFRILELGVGTGTLTARILRTFPHARLTGIDLSSRMIARARKKLRPFRDRVALVAGDIARFPEEPWDAVISALAIHHLRDAEKWRLYRRIHRWLTPGGYFGDGDDHLPEDPIFDTRYSEIASRLAPSQRRGRAWSSPQQVWHEHEQYDHPCTLSAEVAALQRARFRHVGVPWRFFGQAVVWAYP